MPSRRILPRVIVALLGAVASLGAQTTGEVVGFQKISDLAGGFGGSLANEDGFGYSVAAIGDLDGDGVGDMAVGAWGDDDGGNDRGAVWILFLNADGTVKSEQKISNLAGGFTGDLENADRFGYSVAGIGDLDGDGVRDLAVGALFDDDGGFNHGAVWILFLNADGTVKTHQKISDTDGDFQGALHQQDYLGSSLTFLGDHDGDGVGDIASGAYRDGDGGGGTIGKEGSVWILRLDTDGTVKSHQKIGAQVGGFDQFLDTRDQFGRAVASLGDLDGDGVGDLAVGAPFTLESGLFLGALWILFLNPDATVKSYQRITEADGGFGGDLDDQDRLGYSLAGLGDINLDGTPDLGVGAIQDDDGGGTAFANRGAAWILLMNPDGTVSEHRKISDTEGFFGGALDNADFFGHGLAALGDIDGDGSVELASGAAQDDDGGSDRGAIWYLDIEAAKTVAFSNLGHALPGTYGAPLLTGEGTLLADDPLTITLSNGLEFTTAYLVVGLFTAYGPFEGGVLVPDVTPPGFFVPFFTDGTGGFVIPAMWPPGVPSGFELYLQYWLLDPAAVFGWSGSNALKATAP